MGIERSLFRSSPCSFTVCEPDYPAFVLLFPRTELCKTLKGPGARLSPCAKRVKKVQISTSVFLSFARDFNGLFLCYLFSMRPSVPSEVVFAVYFPARNEHEWRKATNLSYFREIEMRSSSARRRRYWLFPRYRFVVQSIAALGDIRTERHESAGKARR